MKGAFGTFLLLLFFPAACVLTLLLSFCLAMTAPLWVPIGKALWKWKDFGLQEIVLCIIILCPLRHLDSFQHYLVSSVLLSFFCLLWHLPFILNFSPSTPVFISVSLYCLNSHLFLPLFAVQPHCQCHSSPCSSTTSTLPVTSGIDGSCSSRPFCGMVFASASFNQSSPSSSAPSLARSPHSP